MSELSSAGKLGVLLSKNLPKLLGRILSKPGRIGEDFARGLAATESELKYGVNPFRRNIFSKDPAKVATYRRLSAKDVKGLNTLQDVQRVHGPDARWIPSQGVGKGGGYFEAAESWHPPEIVGTELTSGGMAAQGAGYALGYGAPATLAYKMGVGNPDGWLRDHGGEQKSHDENGVRSRGYNESAESARAKFNQTYLGGSRTFSMPKYQALREQNKWVDTAIAEMGKENYMKARRALAEGKMSGQQFHDMLTSAVAGLDDDVTKQAATQPYVLPGIFRGNNGKGRFVVISPVKDKNGPHSSYQAFKYDIDDLDNQNSQPQQ